MKGYKGFDKDLKCRDMQYEIGETFTHTGPVSLCNSGLHFVEHPLDAWSYYKPLDGSRFALVKANGVSDETRDDTKRVAQSLTIKAEVKIPALLKAAVEFVFSKVKSSPTVSATTGNYAHSATTGNYAHSATTGNSAHSATTGNSAHSATTGNFAHSATTGNFAHSAVAGKECIAASLGAAGQAKGIKGNWLVLAEWVDGKIKSMGIAIVDGKKIKADTLYTLKDGKFVEAL
jgi:hypothetical protein